MLAICNEFTNDYDETRKRKDFICFDNIVWDNPLMTDDQQLKVWEKYVALTAEVKEEDGKTWIAKPTVLSEDTVKQRGMQRAVAKEVACKNDEELTGAVEKMKKDQAEFQAARDAERAKLNTRTHKLQVEADGIFQNNLNGNQVDTTRIAKRLCEVNTLEASSVKKMKQLAQEQQRQDEEDMEDKEFKAKAQAAKEKNAEMYKDTAEEMRTKKVNFTTRLIEWKAKLEAMGITLKSEKRAPPTELEHLDATDKQQVVDKQNEFETDACFQLAHIKKESDKWIAEHCAHLKAFPTTCVAIDDLVGLWDKAEKVYKMFWGKNAHTKQFYAVMSAWKKDHEKVMKESKN